MLKNKLKNILKKIIYSEKSSSENYIIYLRKLGIAIGEGCRIFSPKETSIDIQNPFMIEFGNNVRISRGVIILTHDYSWSVVAEKYGEIYGGVGKVKIGNNVFIGMNSIILKDTEIGNNVIIGAGSIVKGHLLSDSVYAGNPVKYICSLEDYKNKREDRVLSEAVQIVVSYFDKTHHYPNEDILKEYFFLFKNKYELLTDEQKGLIVRTGASQNIYDQLSGFQPKFDEFLAYCITKKEIIN